MASKKTHTAERKKASNQQEHSKIETDSIAPTRGRTFEGFVTKKFFTRVVVEFERTVYVKKYQRFYKKKTRLHARLPQKIDVQVGDYIRVRECRPLSKIIHFVVIEKVRSAIEAKETAELPVLKEEKA